MHAHDKPTLFYAVDPDSECSAAPARSDSLASLTPKVRLAGCSLYAVDPDSECSAAPARSDSLASLTPKVRSLHAVEPDSECSAAPARSDSPAPHGPKVRSLHAARGRVLVRPRPVFFVRAPATRQLPPSDELDLYLQRYLMRELSGWVQLVVLELLADGSVEWIADAVHGAVKDQGQRLIAVRCVDRRGPRRPGLWAALSIASALAELLDGVVVDPRRSLEVLGERKSSSRVPATPLRPPADARVRTVDHLCVPSSRGLGRRRWLSTVGMAHFGLPDLELVDVPESAAEMGARLLLGVAQHLIDSSWTPPRPGDHPREALLTIGELHWALGGEVGSIPCTRGRGWTRVAIELDVGRAWPELLRVGPPLGARSWRDPGAWIRDAWADLFGPPPANAGLLRATGS